MKITIAVAQLESNAYRIEENYKKAEKYIISASSQRADVVVLPEYFLTGIGSEILSHADRAEQYLEKFRLLAKKYSINIVPGSFPVRSKGKIYNTTYLIDRDGTIKSEYRKVYLWVSEKPMGLTPGTDFICTNSDIGKIGLAICWDLAFPEGFRSMFSQGVQILICPSCWSLEDAGVGLKHNGESERIFIDALCTARSFEEEAIVVFCNMAGTWQVSGEPVCHSAGHSQIATPFNGPVAKLDHNHEEMLLHDIDLSVLRDAENAYQIRRDLLPNESY